MRKLIFKSGMLSGLVLLSVFSVTQVVWSQTSLDRLENQIRQRVGQDHPSPSQQSETPLRDAEEAVPDDSSGDEEPGYLGLLADDQRDRGRGVRVSHIYPGGPAAKGGLKKHDLIISVGGIRTRQMTEMGDVLRLQAAGETVEFDILRDDRPQKIKVTLGRRQTQKTTDETGAEAIPAPPGELAEGERPTIEQLQNRIEELERRVTGLEKALRERKDAK